MTGEAAVDEGAARRVGEAVVAMVDTAARTAVDEYVRMRFKEGHGHAASKDRAVDAAHGAVMTWAALATETAGPGHAHLSRNARLIESYEAKVQDLATETLRVSAAYAALRRTISNILLAARLGEPPLYSGEFFDKGFPPEEREALRTALGEEDFNRLCRVMLGGYSGALYSGRCSPEHPCENINPVHLQRWGNCYTSGGSVTGRAATERSDEPAPTIAATDANGRSDAS